MSGNICDVCGGDAKSVASSPLQAISFAYCQRCAAGGYEPWDSIVVSVMGDTPLSDYIVWFQELVERNLEFYDKTWKELQQESQAFWEEYEQHLRECCQCGEEDFDSDGGDIFDVTEKVEASGSGS